MAAFLASYTTDWLDLIFRWFHATAAIVWIGTSFYFVALDNHLNEPEREEDRNDGVAGESWEIHGGGFYRIHKFRVAPPKLPKPLHWYKWEAYWTWLSGFALLCIVYYTDARLRLIDPSVAKLEPWQAILISLALLVAAWFVYDGLCRVLADRHPVAFWVTLLGLVTATAYGVGQLYAPRAAYIQVGAMLGTIMAANVLFVIIPGHWELIKAKEAGREPDPRPGIVGKQRSVHNSYLTLPVLFTMLAGHSSFTYGHDHAWAVLVALMVVGAAIRHYFIRRHAGETLWWIPVGCALAIAAIAIWLRPPDTKSASGAPAIAFAQAQQVIDARCLPCHSMQPTQPGFSAPPSGIVFDTPQQIHDQAALIRQLAVSSKVMPLGNATKMTQAERDLLGQWIAGGAKIQP